MQQPNAIAVQEVVRLELLERDIQYGMEAFYKAGLALREIRDNRLYKAQFSDFDEYCQQRWNMTKRNAGYLIQAAGVCELLGKHGSLKPTSMRQTRTLAALPEAEIPQVWNEAVQRSDGAVPTKAVLSQVISEREPIERANYVQEVAADSELTIPGAMSQPTKPKLPNPADVMGMELSVLREREGLLEGAIADFLEAWNRYNPNLEHFSVLDEPIEALRELVA